MNTQELSFENYSNSDAYNEFNQLNTIKDKDGNFVKARFVYCGASGSYILKKGKTLHQLCPRCVIIKSNFES